jgi:hypothetical protein
MGFRRMRVNRHIELFGALEDRPEAFVVDEKALREAVDHRAFHPELGDRSLELVGGGTRIDGGQRRESGESGRISADSLAEAVVSAARERHREAGVQEVRRRRGVREHLHVDAGFVHFPDALRTEVFEPVAKSRAFVGLVEMLDDLGVEVMLFDGDDVWF